MVQEGVLAAIAVCAADKNLLASFGAADLVRAAVTANSSMDAGSAASMTSEGVASMIVHQLDKSVLQ